MSYKIEKTEIGEDVVISGWEEGIQDDPYKGIYDMRNCDNVTIPGEVSVAMATQRTDAQIAISGVTYTVDNTTDVFTYSGTPALTINTAVRFTNSGGALPAGLVNTAAYYVLTKPTPTTFTIGTSAGGTQKLVTDNGSGTNTFSVVNMGIPRGIIQGESSGGTYYFLRDSNNRVWVYDSILLSNTGTWVYMNNLASELTAGTRGNIVFWRDCLFLLYGSKIAYISEFLLPDLTLKTNWNLTWQTITTTNIHKAIVSINDDSVYFCNSNTIGLIAWQTNAAINVGLLPFDPTDSDTYIYNAAILPLPTFEKATCLAELGDNLMIGGQNNYIYPWDRVSTNFSTPIFLSENYTTVMVTINTTMYIFCGYKGRIFVTNGANATPFYKIPEYLSNTTNPYIIWQDAAFNRNQLYFGFKSTTNSGTTINEYGGLWAVDVDSVSPVAPRLQNIMSYGTYSGYVSAICVNREYDPFNNPQSDGYGLFMGWSSNGTLGGVDIGISTPYTGGQSYIDTDPIPVGQYLTNKTILGIEYKLAQPLATNEAVTISYRTQMSGSYTDNPMTDLSTLSGWGRPIFEKSQWLQLRVILTSTATSPSYCRLREVRLHLK